MALTRFLTIEAAPAQHGGSEVSSTSRNSKELLVVHVKVKASNL